MPGTDVSSRRLLLPVHQDVEIGAAFLAIGDGLVLARQMEPHDRGGRDHANLGILIDQRHEL
jgi:hypothetical protein